MEKGQWVFTTNVEKYALGQWISENRARKDFNCCQGGRIAKISVSCLPSKDVELSGPGKLYLQLSDNPDSDAELDEVETARARSFQIPRRSAWPRRPGHPSLQRQ